MSSTEATTTLDQPDLSMAPADPRHRVPAAADPPPSLPATPPRLVARAALGLRRMIKRAADRIAPEYTLIEDSVGVIRTRVLGAIAETGIADQLSAGPADAARLAERLGLDPDSTHRVLRAASLYGVVEIDREGCFRLTRSGQMLRSDHETSIAPWLRYLNLSSTQRAYEALPETMRTGEPSFSVAHGTTVWEHFTSHPEEERIFADSMRRFTRADGPLVDKAYSWPESGVICDVAGGCGPLLAAIIAERPGLSGVLVDAPGVLAEADGFLAGLGVRERVELVTGNMFERVDAAADVYLLKDILHDWDDESSLQILRAVRAAMPTGSKLVVIENLQERNEPDPLVSLIDIHMLTQCEGGRQRSASEIQGLMVEAGLRPGVVRPTAGGYSVLEGIA